MTSTCEIQGDIIPSIHLLPWKDVHDFQVKKNQGAEKHVQYYYLLSPFFKLKKTNNQSKNSGTCFHAVWDILKIFHKDRYSIVNNGSLRNKTMKEREGQISTLFFFLQAWLIFVIGKLQLKKYSYNVTATMSTPPTPTTQKENIIP